MYIVFRISKLSGCLAPERNINFAVNLQWKMTIPAEVNIIIVDHQNFELPISTDSPQNAVAT